MTQTNAEDLVFAPLGGAGEIGMNLNLYGYGPETDRRWMIVDLGVTFGNGTTPGVDVIMADPAFIERHQENLVGIVLTHAHEDHVGAVPYLWNRLRCPVFGTPFTLSILKRKLREEGIEREVPVYQVPLSGHFELGPFDLEMVTLTHSIPEPNAIAIHTPAGTVLHTGDWKLDPAPVIGPQAEEETLRRLGDSGILAIVCDSTNIFEPGSSGSESELLEGLTEVIAGCENRVAVGCFASNVARLETIAAAARANGRDVVIAGRSLRRIEEAARENGYLSDVPAFLPEDSAAELPRDRVLIICTGSQGEPRAALSRIAEGDHPRVTLEEGDTVVFSSRVIPGNELAIARLHNLLTRRGVRIVTQKDSFVHVSGHPARDEMIRMYSLVRPHICVPVHGELRHLVEHARLAKECGVPVTVPVENGDLIRLGPGEPGLLDNVPVGRLVLDGNRLVPLDGATVRDRSKVLYNGTATVAVVVDGDGELAAEPQVSTIGLLDGEEESFALETACEAAFDAFERLKDSAREDDESVREAVRLAVRRAFRKTLGKKPVTQVQVIRL